MTEEIVFNLLIVVVLQLSRISEAHTEFIELIVDLSLFGGYQQIIERFLL